MSLNPSIDWQWSTPSFVYGGLNRAKSGGRYASGKGINVCAALKNIGLDPLCLGFNFQENEAIVTRAMDNWGIRHDFVTVDGAVRVNIKLYDDATGTMTELNQPGAFVPDDAIQALYEKFKAATRGATTGSGHILVLSGSMPANVPADTYKHMCQAWPGKVILDADGEALRLALESERPPFCIKPNLYELNSLAHSLGRISGLAADGAVPAYSGQELTTKESVSEFCQMLIREYGVGMICVSMGADGAMLVTGHDAYYVPAPKVKVSAVQGAGDAMVAGLVYGLTQGLPALELLRTATAAAAATIVREGTLMCTYEGFIEHLRQTGVPVCIKP